MTRPVAERLELWSEPELNTGCRLWFGAVTCDGYGKIGWDYRCVAAHRAAWEVANGPIPTGLQVLHICDTPPCIAEAHLFLGTHAENMADRHRKGRYTNAVSDITIKTIFEMRATGVSQRIIAQAVGTSRAHVGQILSGRRPRRHVKQG